MTLELSWLEPSPGKYERPFDPVDSFYRLMMSDWRSQCTITAAVRLHNADHFDLVFLARQAWMALRYEDNNTTPSDFSSKAASVKYLYLETLRYINRDGCSAIILF